MLQAFACIHEQRMTLPDLYPLTRATHITLVLVSGALFGVRGVAVLLGARWPMTPVVRRASYGIDTALLGAALLLLTILEINPFTVAWLGTKLGLLLLYIFLGTLALKRAPTARLRMASLVGALLCYGFMLSVALAHHPLGLFAGLQSVLR
jgi:uncharacterized membrane protein SirB2